jgi:hypothetical protein
MLKKWEKCRGALARRQRHKDLNLGINISLTPHLYWSARQPGTLHYVFLDVFSFVRLSCVASVSAPVFAVAVQLVLFSTYPSSSKS